MNVLIIFLSIIQPDVTWGSLMPYTDNLDLLRLVILYKPTTDLIQGVAAAADGNKD